MIHTDREKRMVALALVPLVILTLFSWLANLQPHSVVAPNVSVQQVHVARVW